jgi:hypothetical protein
MWFNPVHLSNQEARRKIRVNPKNILIIRRVQKPNTSMLGEKTKERKIILAWYVRRNTSPKTSLTLLRLINT